MKSGSDISLIPIYSTGANPACGSRKRLELPAGCFVLAAVRRAFEGYRRTFERIYGTVPAGKPYSLAADRSSLAGRRPKAASGGRIPWAPDRA